MSPIVDPLPEYNNSSYGLYKLGENKYIIKENNTSVSLLLSFTNPDVIWNSFLSACSKYVLLKGDKQFIRSSMLDEEEMLHIFETIMFTHQTTLV